MEAVNGVSELDKGGPPAPSPLTGCYLLIVVGEPHSKEHKDIILRRIAKGLLSWDSSSCHVDLEKELAIISEQAPEGEDARYGERLIQFASENLVTEVLIHPAISTLSQCMKNLLSSFTRHRHIIHAGYTFAGNGSWILQDGTLSLSDFSEAFQEIEVQRILRAYDNTISLDIHCSPEGDWNRLPKESFAKNCKVRVNPDDVLTSGSPAIVNFLNYISPFLIPTDIEMLLESSDVVGNIRFSHPTLYVFPGGQGDAALFGINGFNMLVDGGFGRKACFWDFVRHLDRLDAVLLTRLNNSNVNGISSVLSRKRHNTVYPHIGHFFCNIQERKAILSPDGDKDKDPLLINLFDEGQGIINNLRQLNLQPQPCYREVVPMNLYHKVGHGTLDMYILSPSRDSKEVKEFLQKWNNSDHRLFSTQKNGKEFVFPTYNLVSICALLVWQPANVSDNITRILFPGSSPQHKIFEGLDKLKQLECIKYPSCSAKTLTSTIIKTKLSKTERIVQDQKDIKGKSVTDSKPKLENKIVDEELKNGHSNGIVHPITEKVIKKYDSTESDKSGPQIIETKKDLVNGKTVDEKIDRVKPKAKPDVKPKPEVKPFKPARSVERKTRAPPPIEKKASPTTPKKTVEVKMNGDTPKPKPASKISPSATPAKSAKDANNRKVVESKIKSAPKREVPKPTEKKEAKPERKPISRRPKGTSPVGKMPESPIKKITELHKIETRKPKLEKDGTTDSSTVSTPSADGELAMKKDLSKLTPEEIEQLKARELAELKEEQEVVKEIEAVFRKSETNETANTDMRKIKNTSIDEKTEGEGEEYLIIEKEEVEHDSLDEKNAKEGETQKHLRDSEESEKQRKLSDVVESVDVKEHVEDVKAEIAQEAEVVPLIHSVEEKDHPKPVSKEVSATSPDDKVEESSGKKITDREMEEENKDINILESQPDEKFSTPIESGATTAPTLPEDERIPLDEIKEDIGDMGVEEKYVKEDTKEKGIPVVQLPPKTIGSVAKIPSVVGIRLDKQTPMRDLVKTPDEVADLPVHEEVDIENYEQYQANQAQTPKQSELKLPTNKAKTDEDVPDNEHVKVHVVESDGKLDEEKHDEQKVIDEVNVVVEKESEAATAPVVEEKPQLTDIGAPSADTETVHVDHVLSEIKVESVEKADVEKSVPVNETEPDNKLKDEKSEDLLKMLEAEIIDDNKLASEEMKVVPKDGLEETVEEQVIKGKASEAESPFESRRLEVSMERSEVKVEKIHSTKAEKPFAKEAVEEDEKDKDTTEDLKSDVEQVEEIQLAEKVQLVEAQELMKEAKQDIQQLESELLDSLEGIGKEVVLDALKSAEETIDSVCKAIADEQLPELDAKLEEAGSTNEQVEEEPKDALKTEPETQKEMILSRESAGEANKEIGENGFDIKIVEEIEKLLIGEPQVSKLDESEVKLDTVEIQLEKEAGDKKEADTEEEGTEEHKIDHEAKIRTVREDSLTISNIDKKLQELKDSADSEPKTALMIAELDIVDKLELGRKSPKEREQDVAIIVASVAEVLKSDAPLEEFEGKIPLDVGTFSTIPPYATELRETHITTLESPIRDVVVESLVMDPIEEEKFIPCDPTTMFLNEEKKIAALHTDYDTAFGSKEPSRVTSLLKDSNDLIQATSKMISDIKHTTKGDETATQVIEGLEDKSPVSGKTGTDIDETAAKDELIVTDKPIDQFEDKIIDQISEDPQVEKGAKEETEKASVIQKEMFEEEEVTAKKVDEPEEKVNIKDKETITGEESDTKKDVEILEKKVELDNEQIKIDEITKVHEKVVIEEKPDVSEKDHAIIDDKPEEHKETIGEKIVEDESIETLTHGVEEKPSTDKMDSNEEKLIPNKTETEEEIVSIEETQDLIEEMGVASKDSINENAIVETIGHVTEAKEDSAIVEDHVTIKEIGEVRHDTKKETEDKTSTEIKPIEGDKISIIENAIEDLVIKQIADDNGGVAISGSKLDEQNITKGKIVDVEVKIAEVEHAKEKEDDIFKEIPSQVEDKGENKIEIKEEKLETDRVKEDERLKDEIAQEPKESISGSLPQVKVEFTLDHKEPESDMQPPASDPAVIISAEKSVKLGKVIELEKQADEQPEKVNEESVIPSHSPDLHISETVLPPAEISPRTSLSDAKEDSPHVSGKSSPISVVEQIDSHHQAQLNEKDHDVETVTKDHTSAFSISRTRTPSPDLRTDDRETKDSSIPEDVVKGNTQSTEHETATVEQLKHEKEESHSVVDNEVDISSKVPSTGAPLSGDQLDNEKSVKIVMGEKLETRQEKTETDESISSEKMPTDEASMPTDEASGKLHADEVLIKELPKTIKNDEESDTQSNEMKHKDGVEHDKVVVKEQPPELAKKDEKSETHENEMKHKDEGGEVGHVKVDDDMKTPELVKTGDKLETHVDEVKHHEKDEHRKLDEGNVTVKEPLELIEQNEVGNGKVDDNVKPLELIKKDDKLETPSDEVKPQEKELEHGKLYDDKFAVKEPFELIGKEEESQIHPSEMKHQEEVQHGKVDDGNKTPELVKKDNLETHADEVKHQEKEVEHGKLDEEKAAVKEPHKLNGEDEKSKIHVSEMKHLEEVELEKVDDEKTPELTKKDEKLEKHAGEVQHQEIKVEHGNLSDKVAVKEPPELIRNDEKSETHETELIKQEEEVGFEKLEEVKHQEMEVEQEPPKVIGNDLKSEIQRNEVKHQEEVEHEKSDVVTEPPELIHKDDKLEKHADDVTKETHQEVCAKLDKSSYNVLHDLKSQTPQKLDELKTESSDSQSGPDMAEKSQMSSGKVSPDITVKEVLAAEKSLTSPEGRSPAHSGKTSPVITLEGVEIPLHDVTHSGRSSPEIAELTKDLLDTKQSPRVSRKSTPEIIVDNEFVVLDRLSPDLDIVETIHITESVSEEPKNSVPSVPESVSEAVKSSVPIDTKSEDKHGVSESAEPSLSIHSQASTSEATKVKEVYDLSSGRVTPPTAPVSPHMFKENDKPVDRTDVPVAKSVDIRSATPASDDCDISSGQVSRVLTTEDDDKQVDSDDEEIPGSPLSATSQIAHSISSQYDLEDSVRGAVAMDPMSTSFYGALPDDPVDADKSVSDSPSHIYELTTAKFANIQLQGELQKEVRPDVKTDIMTASFIGSELPSSDSKDDPIASWGKPLGLPSPAPLNDNKGTPKKEKKVITNVMFKNRLNEDKKGKKVNPVYVDLTYVPHNGNSNYSYVDFFKRVRARYYVFSGIEPSKEVYSALLEAKQTWDDKDLEVTIIPTYDTDVLGYWVAENEDLLAKYKIDLSPSASRCTINLQDHETSCSAYRLEFS